MQKSVKLFILSAFTSSLIACSATQSSTSAVVDNGPSAMSQNGQGTSAEVATISPSASGFPQALTLEKIMADPDWIGNQPESAYWSHDGQSFFYSQKRQNSVVKDLYVQDVSDSNAQIVPLETIHQHAYENKVVDKKRGVSAWQFENNLFVMDSNGSVRQLTRDHQRVFNLHFLNDGRLSYQVHDAIYAINVQTGMTEQLVGWTFAEPPVANEEPKDYLSQEQLKLIGVLGQRRNQKQQRFDNKQQLQQLNSSVAAETIYLPSKHRTVEASISPNGRWAIVAIEKDESSRDESDIMPNYINDDGRITAESVRRRVADAEPESDYLWLINLTDGSKKELSYNTLPGYNEDVLEQVKRENAEARGDTYQSNRLPRDIGLLVDWGWSQSAISWHNSGEQVAIMLEAWDNKDRWLTTVDLENMRLETQHRLHDDAWVNYNFNSFGWLNNQQTLFFLSEHSGYSHLYLKPLNGNVKALTEGQFEVDELTLTNDDSYIYYQANQKHPGIYEIYRVAINTGEIEQLTDLNGMTEYVLNDQQSALLLTHSKLTSPPELYIKDLSGDTLAQSAQKMTDTTSEAFKQVDWMAPQIVPVDSSHTEQPIYSRVYLPENYQQGDKRRAVIFNHGAGYLQNSHLGWSGYFREFMFHNLLAQQGYVVMDMDYRASAGYGRDWRTAIYRQMGTPEIQDLADGVDWMVENANVDAKRIGTYGGSYGGFMTFMALFNQPELFQSGAALRPVSDWAHYNHGYTSNILNTPDVDPIAYERSSPIYFAEGLQKPLLINAPMVDNNVFFVDVVRLVQRFIELEKENFETAIYPVEAHGFVEPSSWLDEYRRIYKLFEQTL